MFANYSGLEWQPRAASAYQLRSRTVFGAGIGIFDQPPAYGDFFAFVGNPPSYSTFNEGLFFGPTGGVGIAPGVPNSAVDAAVAANQRFQAGFANGTLSCVSPLSTPGNCLPTVSFNISSANKKYSYPVIYEWSGSIQQQFGNDFGVQLSYLGTRLGHGYYPATDNIYQTACSGCLVPVPFGAFGAAPDPRFSYVYTYTPGANSSYDGLQITGAKRISHGLSFQLNYTYSHCLDEQGNSGYGLFNAKVPIQGVTQPGTIQWLNPNAFESVVNGSMCFPSNTPQNCQQGDAGRNSVRAPGFTWTDLAIGKQFRITERLNFKFETQFYNLFNHPNFGYPNSGVPISGIPSIPGTLTAFGTISNTVAH